MIKKVSISLFILVFSIIVPNTSVADVDLIQPENLEYKGAFRLPDVAQGSDWRYSGYGMTFYPGGDASGPSDGYSGSLFAVGHDQGQMIAEISIPVPVISSSKNLAALNTAAMLQPFTDIRSVLFGYMDLPSPGIEYLPAQGAQSAGKLHFCWSQWIEEIGDASHGWCGLDLSDPQIAGPWHFGAYSNYLTNDFIFEIPESWAQTHTPGLRLVSGRYREGQWSGGGPSLFAYGPWNDGNPPASGSTLTNITLLLSYGSDLENSEVTFDAARTIDNYNLVDTFAGGAWLTSGGKSAVVLCGTKGTGDGWYGYGNGVEYPYLNVDENTVYPEIPDWPYNDRGFWSDGITAQLIFFSPDDLAGVADGTLTSDTPQPYAVMTLDDYLFDGASIDYARAKKHLLGAMAFDRANGIVYIVERRADEEKSVVHVFRIVASGNGGSQSGFNHTAYLAANADLPGTWSKTDCMVHYKVFGFRENRAVAFNVDEYLNANPDLPSDWTFEQALSHYNIFGRGENRLLAFDGQEYLSLYPDLPRDWSYEQAFAHYRYFGKSEGRIASFDETAYLEMYPDLPSSWGQAEAFYHYLLYGRNEGRAYDPYDEDVFLTD